MMRLKLEVFEAVPVDPAETHAAIALQEAGLAAFEKGYAAGWEDAAKTERDGQHRLRAEIAHQLQEIAFTYHEARSHTLSQLEPLLRAMAEVVLPRIAREALVPTVVEAIAALAGTALDAPLTLRVSEQDAGALAEALRGHSSPPLSLVTDDTLAPGQIWLRSTGAGLGAGTRTGAAAGTESLIDIDAACEQIVAAVRNHFHIAPELQKHG